MAVNPKVSFQNIDALQDTSFFRKIVIVGQSNTATEGLYKDIEYDDLQGIEEKFGKSSHIGRALRDASVMLSGFIKPKIWAVSYKDNSAAIARVLETTVSGTATKSFTQKIKIHSLDPFNVITQVTIAHGMRETKGCACASVYANGAISVGSPANSAGQFNAPLPNITTNDVIIEVAITKGDTATAIATKISDAVQANQYSVYSAASNSGVVTFTSKHKGTISQDFSIEFVANSSVTGVTFNTLEDTAGSDAVDISDILTNVKDQENTPLGELDFDYIVVPYSYNINNLIIDAKAKWDNVSAYGNRAMDYRIMQATAINLDNNTELDALTNDNPINIDGITRHLCVLSKDDFIIRPVRYSKISLIESRQFTPIQQEFDDTVTVGNPFTLSSQTGWKDLSRVLASSVARYFIVEKRLPLVYREKSWSNGTAIQSFVITKEISVAESKFTRDILDGTNLNSIYGSDYAQVIDNSEIARSQFDEYIEANTSFDITTNTLTIKHTQVLLNGIQNIFITAFNQ